MKAFFGRYGLKLALYAFSHREDVAAVIKQVIALVEGGKAAVK